MTDTISLRITGLAAGTKTWNDVAGLPGAVDDAAAVARGATGAAVPVAAVLEDVDLPSEATHCSVVTRDGAYSASIPLDDLLRGGWLAFALEGAPLPDDRGGPFRLTVAEGTTLCWNVKDVGELRFTAGAEPDSVPENPPH